MKTDRPREAARLDSDWPETKPALQVLIAYGDVAAGKRAMHVLADLGQGLGDDLEFQPLPWAFDLLLDANWREAAANHALKADILILAATNTNVFPLEIKEWIESTLSRKRGTDSAVVALFGSEEEPDVGASAAMEAIRTAAQRAELAFFAPLARRDLDETVLQIQQRADRITPLLEDVLRQPHPPPHWGINE